MHSVVTVAEQNGGGPMPAVSRSSTGHVCPGGTSRPVAALRFWVIVRPGLLENGPVKTLFDSRLYATA